MSVFASPSARFRRTAILIAVVLLGAPFAISFASFVARPSDAPLLELPVGEDRCLRDTAYMRYHHMDFLKELRDAGVRGGARRQISFLTCIDCHTSRAAFCDRCHDSVSLSPDCFGCHYYP